jgi:hypothetical protein
MKCFYYQTNQDTTEIKVSTFYDIGGMNYLSGQSSPRGYYMAVQPIERGTTEFGTKFFKVSLFEGRKELLFEVKRKSKSSTQKAEDMVSSRALDVATVFATRYKDMELTGEFSEEDD